MSSRITPSCSGDCKRYEDIMEKARIDEDIFQEFLLESANTGIDLLNILDIDVIGVLYEYILSEFRLEIHEHLNCTEWKETHRPCEEITVYPNFMATTYDNSYDFIIELEKATNCYSGNEFLRKLSRISKFVLDEIGFNYDGLIEEYNTRDEENEN